MFVKQGTIIVAIDGSEHALDALKYAIIEAKAFGDKLILVNAQAKIDPFLEKQFNNQDNLQQHYEQQGKRLLASAIELLKTTDLKYEAKIRVGVPSIEITNEAKEQQARCIVLGSRGLGQTLGNVLGSVSYSVIHLATCPITIVPSKEIKL